MARNKAMAFLHKRAKDPPPMQKELISKLTGCTLQEIPEVLKKEGDLRTIFTGSTKGDYQHWAPVVQRCGEYFSKYHEENQHLEIDCHGERHFVPALEEEASTIFHLLEHVIEATKQRGTLLPAETLRWFLNSASPKVVYDALNVIQLQLVSQKSSYRALPDIIALKEVFLALAGGWGAVPSLTDACTKDAFSDEEQAALNSLCLEFFRASPKDSSSKEEGSATPPSITLISPDMYQLKIDNIQQAAEAAALSEAEAQSSATLAGGPWLALLRALAKHLPANAFVPFWLRVRLSNVLAPGGSAQRQWWVRCRLLALSILALCSTEHLSLFFHYNPYFHGDLPRLFQVGNIPKGVLTSGLCLLASLVTTHHGRQSQGQELLQAIGVNMPQGSLVSLFASSVEGLKQTAASGGALDDDTQDLLEGLFACATLTPIVADQPGGTGCMMAALNALVAILTVRMKGVEKMFCCCLNILEQLAEHNAFRQAVVDAGTLQLCLQYLREQVAEVKDRLAAAPDAATGGPILSSAREAVLIRLFRVIAALINSNLEGVRPKDVLAVEGFPECLMHVMAESEAYGGSGFCLGAGALTALMNSDPSVLPTVYQQGFLKLVLDTMEDVPLDSRVILVLPSLLAGLCLNTKGLEEVKRAQPFQKLLATLTAPKYRPVIDMEVAQYFGQEANELLRHQPVLRESSIAAIDTLLTEVTAALDAFLAHRREAGPASKEEEKAVSTLFTTTTKVLAHILQGSSDEIKQFIHKEGTKHMLRVTSRVAQISAPSTHVPVLLDVFRIMVSLPQCASIVHKELKEGIVAEAKVLHASLAVAEPDISGPALQPHLEILASYLMVLASLYVTGNAFLQECAKAPKLRDFFPDLVKLDCLARRQLIARTFAETKPSTAPPASASSEPAPAPIAESGPPADATDPTPPASGDVAMEPTESADGAPSMAVPAGEAQAEAPASPPSTATPAGDSKKDDGLKVFSMSFRALAENLCKALSVGRRDEYGTEPPSRQAREVSGDLARLCTAYLTDALAGDPLAGTAEEQTLACLYLESIVGYTQGIHFFFFDERRKFCNTLVLRDFHQEKGLEAFLALYRRWFQQGLAKGLPTSGSAGGETTPYEKALAALARLLLRLVSPEMIVGSPMSSSLFVDHSNGGFDPPAFARTIQTTASEAIMDVWSQPGFSGLADEVVNKTLEAVAHTVSDYFKQRKPAAEAPAAPAAKPKFEPSEECVAALTDMGFTRPKVVQALRAIGSNNITLATEWILAHLDEEPEADDELQKAIQMSLEGAEEEPKKKADEAKAKEEEEGGPRERLVHNAVDWCLALVTEAGRFEHGCADILHLLCTHDEGQRQQVIERLCARLHKEAPGPSILVKALLRQLAYFLNQPTTGTLKPQFLQCPTLLPDLLAIAQSLVGRPELAAGEVSDARTLALQTVALVFPVLDAFSTVPTKPAEGKPVKPEEAAVPNSEADPKPTPVPPAPEGPSSTSSSAAWKAVLLPEESTACPLSAEQRTQVIGIAARLLLDWRLDSNSAECVLTLLSHLTRASHPLALQLLDSGVLPALFQWPAALAYPGLPAAATAILRNILDDPHSLQTHMESHMRRFLSRIFAESEKGPLPDGVLFIPRTAGEPGAEDRERPKEVPAEDGPAPMEEDEDKRDTPRAPAHPDQEPVLALPAFLREMEAERKKGDGALFLNAFLATCQLLRRRRPTGEAEFFVALRPSPSRPHYVKVAKLSRKAGKPVEEIMQLVLRTFSARYEEWTLGKEGAEGHALPLTALMHILTDLAAHYPLCAAQALRYAPDPKSPTLLALLLRDVLPYTTGAPHPPGMKNAKALGEQASHFLLAMMARHSARLMADVTQALTEDGQSCHIVHGVAELIWHLLSHATQKRKTPADPRKPYSEQVVRRLVKSGVVKALCVSLAKLDLNHPAASDVSTALTKCLEFFSKVNSAGLDKDADDAALLFSPLVQPAAPQSAPSQASGTLEPLDRPASGPTRLTLREDEEEALSLEEAPAAQPEALERRLADMEEDNDDDGAESSDDDDDDDDHDDDDGDGEDDEAEEEGGQGAGGRPFTLQGARDDEEDAGEEDEESYDGEELDDFDDADDGAGGGGQAMEVNLPLPPSLMQHAESFNELRAELEQLLGSPDMFFGDSNRRTFEELLSQYADVATLGGGAVFQLGPQGAEIRVGRMPLVVANRLQPRGGRRGAPDGSAADAANAAYHPLSLQDPASPATATPVQVIRPEGGFSFGFDSLFGGGGRAAQYLLRAAPPRPAAPEPLVSAQQFGEALQGFLASHAPDSLAEVPEPTHSRLGTISPSPTHEEAAAPQPAESPPPPEAADLPAAGPPSEPVLPAEPPGSGPAEPAAPAPVTEPAPEVAPEAPAETPAPAVAAATAPASADSPVPMDLTAMLMQALMSASDAAPAATPAVPADTPATPSPTEAPTAAATAAPPAEPAPAPSAPAGPPMEDTLDPTFLAALPAELRAEILAQHMTSLMTQAPDPATGSTISSAFLQALPEDIRAEVLEQERQVQAAQRRLLSGEAAAGGGSTGVGGPADIDPATFLATLPPELRQDILLNSDDTVLSSLPADLVAEAYAIQEMERERALRHQLRAHRPVTRAGRHPGMGPLDAESMFTTIVPTDVSTQAGAPEVPAPKSTVSLIPDDTLYPLVRLMYLAKFASRAMLQRTLTQMCRSRRTCLLLLRLLRRILCHASTPIEHEGEAVLSRLFGLPAYVPLPPAARRAGTVPVLALSRALDTLSYLANHTDTVKLLLASPDAAAEVAAEEKEKDVAAPLPPESGKDCFLADLFRMLRDPAFMGSSELLTQLTLILDRVVQYMGQAVQRERKRLAAAQALAAAAAVATPPPADAAAEAPPPPADAAAAALLASPAEAPVPVPADPALVDAAAHASPASPPAAPVAAAPAEPEAPVVPDAASAPAAEAPPAAVADSATRPALEEPQPAAPPAVPVPAEAEASSSSSSSSSSSATLSHAERYAQLFATVPELLSGLVHVLEWPDCSETTRQQAVNIMKGVCGFCALETKMALVAALLRGMQHVAAAVVAHLPQAEADPQRAADWFAAAGPGAPEILLHRLIQSFAAVAGDHAQAAALAKEHAPSLDPLWAAASQYLRRITEQLEQTKETKPSGVTLPAVVLPLVESFFIFHSIQWDEKAEELEREPSALERRPSRLGREPNKAEQACLQFVEKNRRLLNTLVAGNISLLSSSLAAFMRYPRYVDFENKRLWFREQVRRDQEAQGYHSCRLQVRRANVFQDSFFSLNSRQPEELKGRLRVVFKREEGVDAGGLTREWFTVLSKEMFNPNYALFVPSAEGMTYQPNTLSAINPEHLNYFKFVGRVVGMAVFHDVHLDCYFTRSFYKHMLGILPTYHDIESISPDYFKQLVWTLENDLDALALELTFSIEADDLGKHEVIDLVPNGRNVPVTNTNKEEFVTLITEYKMTKAIKEQIDAFLGGFYEIVPKKLISIFTEHELELLISGMPDVNVEDLKANTEYVGYTSASPVILWFWKVVEAMNREERSMLVQFITGSSKVPLGGFKDLQGMHGTQKFNIHRTADTTRLPSAHTCFNQLDLPEYTTFEQLQDMLVKAVTMGHLGFGFV